LFDQQGKLSVMGIFRHVWVASYPALHPRTHLVLRLRAQRNEIGGHALRIRFIDDQGNELLGGEGAVHFGEPPAGITDVEAAAVLVFDVPLPRPGVYHFVIMVDGRREADVLLTTGSGTPQPTGEAAS
jgi:hypothetical protein